MKWIWSVTVLLSAAIAVGKEENEPIEGPDFYEYVLPLEVENPQGVVQLQLPVSLYRQAQSPTLNDVRIFDSEGKSLPWAFLDVPQQVVEPAKSTLKATLFPFESSNEETLNAGVDLDIRTNAVGSVISVASKNKAAKKKNPLGGYILDFGPDAQDKLRIEMITFHPKEIPASYSGELWVEASQDLRLWQPMAAATLQWLRNESGEQLVLNSIKMSPQAFRYARLKWTSGEPLPLVEVEALALSQPPSSSNAPDFETIWVEPQPGKFRGDFVYNVGVALPVEEMFLRMKEKNVVFPFAVGSYEKFRKIPRDTEERFRFSSLQHATFFHIQFEGKDRTSAPLLLSGIQRQEWVIRSMQEETKFRPELGVRWRPRNIVFLAGGVAPYALYFGRGETHSAEGSLTQVAPGFSVEELSRAPVAQVGVLKKQNPKEIHSSPKSDGKQKVWILWATLFGGLSILLFFTLRVMKEMKKASN